MQTLATTRSVGAMLTTALCLAVAGCQWEAEPAAGSQSLSMGSFFYDPNELSESSCLAHETPVGTQGCPRAPTGAFPGCGAPFSVDDVYTYGQCNLCDGDCAPEPLGSARCTCHAQTKLCLFHDPGCACGDVGAECDCGDGRGAIYYCDCEGGGDHCNCRDQMLCH